MDGAQAKKSTQLKNEIQIEVNNGCHTSEAKTGTDCPR